MGSGRFNMFADRPMKDWVTELPSQANAVVALGDCACWGGIPANAPNPTDSVGLQYLKRDHGGFLGARLHVEMGSAGDQHSGVPLPSRLGHPNLGGDRQWTSG